MSFWCHRFDQISNENIVRISALIFFVASWGLPGSFLGLPGDLVNNMINKEAYRKPPRSYKKFQGRSSYNIFVAILENRCLHKFILRFTDLYWPHITYVLAFSYKRGRDILKSQFRDTIGIKGRRSNLVP